MNCPICNRKITLNNAGAIRKHGGSTYGNTKACDGTGFTPEQARQIAEHRKSAFDAWWAVEEKARALREAAEERARESREDGAIITEDILAAEAEADRLYQQSRIATDWRPPLQ